MRSDRARLDYRSPTLEAAMLLHAMNLKQDKYIKQFAWLSIVGLFPISVEAKQFISAPTSSLEQHQLIAQAFVDERCPQEYVYLLGYTRNYSVIICGERSSGKPTHYLGVSRRNNSSILLPLSTYTETRFVARNGEYTYTLDLKAQTLTLGIPGRRPIVERFTAETP